MSRGTYIGPFGRILPIPEDREPERHHLPDNALDETRHNMATYQLPPPERLQFGTDMTCGFTEPMRYNTISQSSRTHGSSHPLFVEPSRHNRHEQLPSVSQLLTPSKKPNVPSPPSSSPQHSPSPPQQPPLTAPHNQGPSSDLVARAPHYSTYPDHSPSSATAQVQSQPDVSPLRESYPISLAGSNFPSYVNHNSTNITPYNPSFETHPQTPYSSQIPQGAAPTILHQQPNDPLTASYTQPILSADAAHSQHMPPFMAQALYFQGQSSTYQGAAHPVIGPEQSPSAAPNTVKPQPRVVAERDVPGEGPSWVYEDGSTCKKVIDGELVNAQWGVTKAGKPRKRLAIACTTCREKKIKCDPAEPKCVQCEKFGRECRFTTA